MNTTGVVVENDTDTDNRLSDLLNGSMVFWHSIIFFVIGILSKKVGWLSPDDSTTLSKLTFKIVFPCLLFSSVLKAEFKFSMWPVAVASIVTHAFVIFLNYQVYNAARFPSRELRGTMIINSQGFNIGFIFPLVLASRSLSEHVFPAVVVWDMSANVYVILVVNYFIARTHAPPKQTDDSALRLLDSADKEAFGAISPADEDKLSVKQNSVKDISDEDIRTHTECEADIRIEMTSTSSVDEPATVPAEMEVPQPSSSKPKYMRPAQPQDPGSNQPSLRPVLIGLLTNPPLIAEAVALVLNLSGVRMAPFFNDLLWEMGQPYTLVLFVILGINLHVPPRSTVAAVGRILMQRAAISVPTAILLWFAIPFPDTEEFLGYRQGMVLCVFTPCSSMALGYVMLFGYGSLPRLVSVGVFTISCVVSFLTLFALIFAFSLQSGE